MVWTRIEQLHFGGPAAQVVRFLVKCEAVCAAFCFRTSKCASERPSQCALLAAVLAVCTALSKEAATLCCLDSNVFLVSSE